MVTQPGAALFASQFGIDQHTHSLSRANVVKIVGFLMFVIS
jgi:hypothetical protein